jgi:hypothetical protein
MGISKVMFRSNDGLVYPAWVGIDWPHSVINKHLVEHLGFKVSENQLAKLDVRASNQIENQLAKLNLGGQIRLKANKIKPLNSWSHLISSLCVIIFQPKISGKTLDIPLQSPAI